MIQMPFVSMMKLKNSRYFISLNLPPSIGACFNQSNNLCLNVTKKNLHSLLSLTPN